MADNALLERRKRKCKDMRLPDYILDYEGTPGKDEIPAVPKSPMIVFVNSKSGGQLGSLIIKSFRELLNPKQVFLENQTICLRSPIAVIAADRLSVKKKPYVFAEVVLY